MTILSLQLTLVVLVFVGQGVVDEHIFTVDDGDSGSVSSTTLTAPLMRQIWSEALRRYSWLTRASNCSSRFICLSSLFGSLELPKHRAWDLSCIVVLERFFELKLDLLIVRNQLLLVGEYHAAFLIRLQSLLVDRLPLLLLLLYPLFFLGVDPLVKEFLSLGVRLHQDVVLVKFKVVHCLQTGKDRLNAVELGQAKRLRFIGVCGRSLP